MGRAVTMSVADTEGCEIVCGVDVYDEIKYGYPVFTSPALIDKTTAEKIDAIIDFSNPAGLAGLLEFAVANSIPAVICTTGLNEAQINLIKDASQKIPVFFSANMSLGVNLVCELVISPIQRGILYPCFLKLSYKLCRLRDREVAVVQLPCDIIGRCQHLCFICPYHALICPYLVGNARKFTDIKAVTCRTLRS